MQLIMLSSAMGKEVLDFFAGGVILFTVFADLCNSILFAATGDDEMGPDGEKIHPKISNNIISELSGCNAALSHLRKKRKIPPTLAFVDAVEKYTQLNGYPLHRTKQTCHIIF
ncbi:pre-mRNA-processing factor 19-like [Olea europaea subsp. europaea]|uniref:Pre-mRNA-processing factor 19 n=1 Tax=Olea europaea subsp. europaea TaxID=158383 RepID=A0A8S0PMX4_OLEEU|nr:pre-mRNA-processing factor 19-like [Olea europaea subsp. europaea]